MWFRYPTVILLLYLTSLHSYLLFHTTVEILSLVVAASTFMFAWNSRNLMKNSYFLFIGISFFFIALLDFAHTLTYPGIQVFPSITPNPTTQLWLSARLLQALAFFIAPSFISRKLPILKTVIVLSAITAYFLLDVFFFKTMPVSYIPGIGLTQFKKASEILISIIFMAAVIRTSRLPKENMDRRISLYIQLSLVLSILSEMLFSAYYAFSSLINMAGHLVRLSSNYFVYKAIIEIGLSQPYQMMFLEIGQLNSRKDEFISTASHEIKNPLTVIKLYSGMLEKKLKAANDAKSVEAILQINRQADQITRLLGDMQDANHLETGKLSLDMKPFRLDQLFRQVLSDIRPTLHEHRLVFHSSPKIAFRGDSARLSQVLVNLLTNAAKYSPTGTKIEVSLSRERSQIKISVRDYGPGISREDQSRLFSRYYRTSQGQASASGLGLGLYLCREIVALHQGRIWVESELGHGSTFHISLPTKM